MSRQGEFVEFGSKGALESDGKARGVGRGNGSCERELFRSSERRLERGGERTVALLDNFPPLRPEFRTKVRVLFDVGHRFSECIAHDEGEGLKELRELLGSKKIGGGRLGEGG